MANNIIHYIPPPITKQFMLSNALVRGLMGPMGSGKSTACCMEIVRRACLQKKGFDGMRRSRWLVIRNTYPELKDTTIKTFQDWFSPFIIQGSYVSTSPPRQVLTFDDVHMEIIFTALDSLEDTRKLLSLDITGAWINEARELPKEIIQYLIGRVGRTPPKKMVALLGEVSLWIPIHLMIATGGINLLKWVHLRTLLFLNNHQGWQAMQKTKRIYRLITMKNCWVPWIARQQKLWYMVNMGLCAMGSLFIKMFGKTAYMFPKRL
jgi:hypothetical protein